MNIIAEINGSRPEEIATVLFALVVVLIAARAGGEIAARLRQSPVLGELVVGVVLGNLCLLGVKSFSCVANDPVIDILSEIGIILLLFNVGLESDINKVIKVGPSSLLAAAFGVLASFGMGWVTAMVFMPHASPYVHAFIATMISSTSISIAARVFMDLGFVQTNEARTVLAAAVSDDVMGLVIVAIVTGVITAAGRGGSLSVLAIVLTIAKAVLFLAGSLYVGRKIVPKIFHFASRSKLTGMLLTAALVLCFGLGYLSTLMGLAPIIGAFAAGLLLEEVHFRSFTDRGEHSVLELVKPLVGFLAPIFFVRMGSRVDLSTFAQPKALAFAAALTAAAILGKQACRLGLLRKNLDTLSIAMGMVPRGEVTLICAAIGAKLIIDGRPVVDAMTYSAAVIVVVVTTLVTPPLLKWSLARGERIRRQA